MRNPSPSGRKNNKTVIPRDEPRWKGTGETMRGLMETENDGGGSENNRKDLFITLSISSFLIKEFYLFPNYTIPSDATVRWMTRGCI